MSRSRPISVSVIVTAHSEGIIVHKTLRSIFRAGQILDTADISWELILHLDTPTPETLHYIDSNKEFLKDVTVLTNTFGNPSQSRNYAVSKAHGKYVTFIDGDDLMCERWLIDAFHELEKRPLGSCVAHTEMTVEFGAFNSIVQKYPSIDKQADSLLSVFAGRWNVNIFAPRKLLEQNPYTLNKPGFGYEDWYLSCTFIQNGIESVLIPRTVLFVRRKESGSVWAREKLASAVLPAHPLFGFGNFRNLSLDSQSDKVGVKRGSRKASYMTKVKTLAQKTTTSERAARYIHSGLRKLMSQHGRRSVAEGNAIPSWLSSEWLSIHEIDRSTFPSPPTLAQTQIYHTITPDHYRVGEAYWTALQSTTHNSYGYILFVPWLVEGGADMFAINYANYINRLAPNKNVLVIATNNNALSPWRNKLDKGIDFIDFGNIAGNLPQGHQHRLLEQLIENSGSEILHILNSALAYDFIDAHRPYLASAGKKVVITSYSQSVDDTGRVFGFSHTHVPPVYDIVDYITTDNLAVIQMWRDEYGFNSSKMLLHRQPFNFGSLQTSRTPHTTPFKVLWAARLAPEKMPELVAQIGQLSRSSDIEIDMYGKSSDDFNTDFLNALPPNVTYRGPFDGLATLPLEKYSAFLYTSLFDGTPNTLIEIGGAGIPIVSSAVGGIPDLLKDHNNALLIDGEQLRNAQAYVTALLELKSNPELGKRISQSLSTHVTQKFGAKQFEEDLRDLCRKLGYIE